MPLPLFLNNSTTNIIHSNRYIARRDSKKTTPWENALIDVKSFTRDHDSTEWTEVPGQNKVPNPARVGQPVCESFDGETTSHDASQLIHEDTFTGRKVFNIGYLDRMQSMTPGDRAIKIHATLMSLQAGGDHAAMAWAYRTETSSEEDGDVFATAATSQSVI